MDATVSWGATTTGTPTSYAVVWTQNGTAFPPVTVPVTSAQDATGYSLDLVTSVPTITLKAGDVIGATVQSIDATNGLSSSVVPSSPASVTIPTGPVAPGVPVNVTLALS